MWSGNKIFSFIYTVILQHILVHLYWNPGTTLKNSIVGLPDIHSRYIFAADAYAVPIVIADLARVRGFEQVMFVEPGSPSCMS
jgi:hypothetical protein